MLSDHRNLHTFFVQVATRAGGGFGQCSGVSILSPSHPGPLSPLRGEGDCLSAFGCENNTFAIWEMNPKAK
jgi:hypothetical protein